MALEGHTANVTSCAWSPDGTQLATASAAVTKIVGGWAAQAPLTVPSSTCLSDYYLTRTLSPHHYYTRMIFCWHCKLCVPESS